MGISLKQHFKRRLKLQLFNATLLGTVLTANTSLAQSFEYPMKPVQVAENTWYIEAVLESFTPQNGGAIANVAFVVDGNRVLVIDSGPSKRFGEQLRQQIVNTTGQEPTDLLLTHHHPDHSLGNQAFADINIWALKETANQLKTEGNAFAESLYLMVGDWMRGTEILAPNKLIEAGLLFSDSDRFEVIALTGHTGADLLLLDRKSRVLFASDMIFFQRALATPHTPGLDVWLADIDYLRTLPFDRVIPGHGPVTSKAEALDQMEEYLRWLDQLLSESASQGLTMNELRGTEIPAEFSGIALTRYELTRTIAHLYPNYELKAFSKK